MHKFILCRLLIKIRNTSNELENFRIKDETFCFAHLRWCHSRWATNIVSSGCNIADIHVIAAPTSHLLSSNGWTEIWPKPIKFLVDDAKSCPLNSNF